VAVVDNLADTVDTANIAGDIAEFDFRDIGSNSLGAAAPHTVHSAPVADVPYQEFLKRNSGWTVLYTGEADNKTIMRSRLRTKRRKLTTKNA